MRYVYTVTIDGDHYPATVTADALDAALGTIDHATGVDEIARDSGTDTDREIVALVNGQRAIVRVRVTEQA